MTQTNIFRIIYSYLCPHVQKYDKIKKKKLPTYPNSFISVTLNTILLGLTLKIFHHTFM